MRDRLAIRLMYSLVAAIAVATARAGGEGASESAFPSGAGTMLEAQSAYTRGDFDRAALLLTELVQRETQNAVAWLRLGRALAQRGSYTEAWRAYDRVVELAANEPADRDARSLELEARRDRAEVAIDAALEDVRAARELASDVTANGRLAALESRLATAREGNAPAANRAPLKSIRADGRVITRESAEQSGVQIIEGNKTKKDAKATTKPGV
jgi:tetratricopeptide (TPR) repeat protein